MELILAKFLLLVTEISSKIKFGFNFMIGLSLKIKLTQLGRMDVGLSLAKVVSTYIFKFVICEKMVRVRSHLLNVLIGPIFEKEM